MNARASAALACSLALLVQPALGQQNDSTQEDEESSGGLSTITGVGTRTERTIKEIAATVSIALSLIILFLGSSGAPPLSGDARRLTPIAEEAR